MAKRFTVFMSSAVLVLICSGPAGATQSISCTDMKQDSGVDILLGAGPVSNVLSVSISMGERQLTTAPGMPGEMSVIAQAFDDGEVFRIDLMDDQATRLVASIRLLLGDDDTDPVRIGYVRIDDEAPIAISCIGP